MLRIHLSSLAGLFRVCKLPRLNGLTTVVPETLDLAFKLRRTGFRIEVRGRRRLAYVDHSLLIPS